MARAKRTKSPKPAFDAAQFERNLTGACAREEARIREMFNAKVAPPTTGSPGPKSVQSLFKFHS